MARALEQIIAELDPGYAGSRKTTQTQIDALPGQTEQQMSGLQAQAQQSHTDILDSSRRRGLGFSGIPIGEQVKYDSTVFKPAVANLQASQNTRQMSLEEALNSLYRDQRNQATGIQQGEIGREEQTRQFEANLAWQREQMDRQERMAREQAAAASRSAAGYFGGGGAPAGASPSAAGAARFERTPGGGYNFFDQTGRPVSAIAFAGMSNGQYGVRQLLSEMAKTGDRNAQVALDYVGNDGKFGKAASGNIAAALRALGAEGNYINDSTARATNFNAPLSVRMGL